MIEQVKVMLDQYVRWIRDNTTLREIGDSVEITTPYLDRHNDYIQIYAKRVYGELVLTDDGYTLADLAMCGCEIYNPRFQDEFRVILNGFGIREHLGALEVGATESDFPLRKCNLVQAMLAVNDLSHLAPSTVSRPFREDVAAWFHLREIRFQPRVNVEGRSGLHHQFDFALPPSASKPERLVRVIGRPGRSSTNSVVLSWRDIQETRAEARALAFLNDAKQAVPPAILSAMRRNEVQPVAWSAREEALEALAA